MKKLLLSAVAILLCFSSIAVFASCSDDSTDGTFVSVSSDGETGTEGTSSENINGSGEKNDGETTSDTTDTESDADTTSGENWSQDRK